ncbi:MAG: hypothetical protein EPN92_04655 [Chitinophagaceae bacterium]|nr:MAG: hypothetical protein EPN92_04655 [Chitinophagaceae bacterium]
MMMLAGYKILAAHGPHPARRFTTSPHHQSFIRRICFPSPPLAERGGGVVDYRSGDGVRWYGKDR